MGKNFEYKNQYSGEMEKIDDLALERLAVLVRDMENQEEAIKTIGYDKYIEVQDFLNKKKEEKRTEKKLEEKEMKEAIDRNRDDIKDLYRREK